MKHIFRKPLIPGVLLLLLTFGVCFLTLFQQNILDDQRSVDEMYNSVQLTFEVFPSADGLADLRSKTAKKLMEIEGVSRCFYHYECRYSVREPMQMTNLSTLYGVNDITYFAQEQGVQVTYGDGWDEQAVLSLPAKQDDPVPCLLEVNLAAVLGVEPGDTFVAASNPNQDVEPRQPLRDNGGGGDVRRRGRADGPVRHHHIRRHLWDPPLYEQRSHGESRLLLPQLPLSGRAVL